jgi:hypothetical protein
MGIKSTIHWILACCMGILSLQTNAQSTLNPSGSTVVLFLPLHLDSIYDAQGQYRLKRYEFPRFVSAPLEFYQGFKEALDSLRKSPGDFTLRVIDTRSESSPMRSLFQNDSITKANLWLFFGNAAESRVIAEASKNHKVPVININLPNHAGIENNPFYFLWNNTLETQCEGIYRHWQQYYPLEDIILVRKKGSIEDRILNHIKEVDKNTRSVPIRYRILETADSITTNALAALMDSTKQTVLFGASLDERFARNLATATTSLVKTGYKVELMGMSTWENIKELNTTRFRNTKITIPTPFFYRRADDLSKRLQSKFLEINYSKPSDTYLRGYEIAWMLHALLQKNKDLAEVLPGPKKLLFGEINWQPAIDTATLHLNYFENKKIYFVKRMEGSVLSVR